MARFGRDNHRGGGKFGKRNFGGRDNRHQMHDAVCDNCGKRCQVPFRPTGDRPVLCSECFGKERGERGEGGKRDFGRNDRMYSATCSNCGKKCEVPFLPTGNRPVYCNDCFEQGTQTAGGGRDERKKEKHFDNRPGGNSHQKEPGHSSAQIEALHVKLDKILNILAKTPAAPVPKASKPKAAAKKAAPKKSKKK